MENNTAALLTAVKDMILSASKEHEDIVMQNVKDICAMVLEKISEMNKDIVRHNNDMKRRNIVMYGIPEEEEERGEKTTGKVLHVINSVMEQNVQEYEIDSCVRLGRRNSKYLGRPVLIKFTTEWRKREILRRGHMLKGRKVFVDEDHTKEVMERRKQLIPMMMQMRKENKHAILKKDKLYVNGVEWKEIQEHNVELVKTEKNSKKKYKNKQNSKIKKKNRK